MTYLRKAELHVQMKPGVLGVKVRIMPPDAKFPDQIQIVEEVPKEEVAEAAETREIAKPAETVETAETKTDETKETKETEGAEGAEGAEK